MKIIHYYSAAPDEKNSLRIRLHARRILNFSPTESAAAKVISAGRSLYARWSEREKNARRHSSGRKVAAICQEGGN